MKMILALAFAFTAFGAFAANNYIDAVGTVKTQAKQYIAVINSANAALTVGEGVCLDLTADDGISVDYCVTGFPPIGVIVDTSCAVGARCKVQTKGMFETVVLDVTQGNAVAGSSAYVHTDGSVYGDTTDTDKQPLGIFLDAASASGTAQVYITR